MWINREQGAEGMRITKLVQLVPQLHMMLIHSEISPQVADCKAKI